MDNNKSVKIELEFSPAVFDPNMEQLQAIVKEVSVISADPHQIDSDQLAVVSTTRKKLMRARTAITKRGKEAREEAQRYVKQVIAYEKELVGIIEPEEKRLKGIEQEVKDIKIQEDRMKTLPEYKQRFIDAGIVVDDINTGMIASARNHGVNTAEELDDFLLSLDTTGRETFYNECLRDKLEQERLEIERQKEREEEERRAAQEAERLAKEQAEKEKEEKELAERIAKLPERKRRIDDLGVEVIITDEFINTLDDVAFETYYNELVARKNEEKARALEDERLAQEAEEMDLILTRVGEELKLIKTLEELEEYKNTDTPNRKTYPEEESILIKHRALEITEELKEAEAKEASQKAREADEKYQAFLQQHGYKNDGTFRIEELEGVTFLYKLLGTFNK